MLKTIRRKLIPFEIRAEYFRIQRKIINALNGKDLTNIRTTNFRKYPHLLFVHSTKLIKNYPEPWHALQYSKIGNLEIAVKKLDGVVLPPGKKFSFWKLVGKPSKSLGFQPGMCIHDRELTTSIGGGLCQLSNALYWTALNLGLTIIERHRHSYDFFPDTERVVPFGTGATVFYNYKDLVFQNNDTINYFFKLFLDNNYLHVHAYSDYKPEFVYKIIEENHSFIRAGYLKSQIKAGGNDKGKIFRQNEIFRIKYKNKEVVEKKLIIKNKAEVLYGMME